MDEIDQEILGGNATSFSTNVFVKAPTDTHEIYGLFGKYYDVGGSITDFHNYTIDWNEHRIIWSVDDVVIRTLYKGFASNLCRFSPHLRSLFPAATQKYQQYHFPSHPARIQLGIWDASSPEGTSEWARGPIDWKNAPSKIAAKFKSITVECPY